jgi:hypothetical protein
MAIIYLCKIQLANLIINGWVALCGCDSHCQMTTTILVYRIPIKSQGIQPKFQEKLMSAPRAQILL